MSDRPRTVRELLMDPPAPDERVAVRGYLLDEGGHAVLCDRLAESFPPQPGGDVVPSTGLDVPSGHDVETTGDTTWTSAPRVVVGHFVDRVFHIDPSMSQP